MKAPTITTLPNGLRIVLAPRAEATTATVLILVGTGSEHEAVSEKGLSHFLEHMYFKGTTLRPTSHIISSELDALGAVSNAFTSQEYTGYYAKGNPKHVTTCIDILSDIYLNSTFPEAEIEKERGVIIEEINMYEDNHRYKAVETVLSLMYGDQPAGWPTLGTKETVTSFSRADFIRYKDMHYHAANTIVVVSGLVDEEVVRLHVERAFADINERPSTRKNPVIVSQDTIRVKVVNRPIDQAHLAITFHSVPLGHPSYATAQLVGGILGSGMSSRLFQRLREDLGVAYSVEAGQEGFTDHGVFGITCGIDKARVNETVRALAKEFAMLKETFVSLEELTKARDYMLSMMRIGLETTDEVAGFYGGQLILGQPMRTPETITDEYMAVTPEMIRSFAQELFVGVHATVALVGPFEATDLDSSPIASL